MKPDTFAGSYIPPSAVQCWADDQFVYTAIPTKAGPPLINKYALTEGGLSKALDVLKVQRKLMPTYNFPKQDFKRKPSDLPKLNMVQRDAARAILKRMKII